jgi:hypothetical protein
VAREARPERGFLLLSASVQSVSGVDVGFDARFGNGALYQERMAADGGSGKESTAFDRSAGLWSSYRGGPPDQ